MLLMIVMSAGTYILIRFILRRMIEITLDASSLGIHHLGPGKKRLFRGRMLWKLKLYLPESQTLRSESKHLYFNTLLPRI